MNDNTTWTQELERMQEIINQTTRIIEEYWKSVEEFLLQNTTVIADLYKELGYKIFGVPVSRNKRSRIRRYYKWIERNE